MAIEKTIEHKGFEASYLRIITLRVNALAEETQVTLALYKDRDVRLGKQTDYVQDFVHKIDGIVSIAEAYEHLKTLEPYSDAVDVLEE